MDLFADSDEDIASVEHVDQSLEPASCESQLNTTNASFKSCGKESHFPANGRADSIDEIDPTKCEEEVKDKRRNTRRSSISQYGFDFSYGEEDELEIGKDRKNADAHSSSVSEIVPEEEEGDDVGEVVAMETQNDKVEWPKILGVQADAGEDAGPFVLSEDQGVSISASVNRYLRDYQRKGVRWIYKRYAANCGCLLNDDMGLGKTVQIASLLTAVYRKTGLRKDSLDLRQKQRLILRKDPEAKQFPKTTVILCPTAVLHQWEKELHKWGCFSIQKLVSGNSNEKLSVIEECRSGVCEILLTTYDTFKIHSDELSQIDWECCIMDEVHSLKNIKSKTHQAIAKIKTPRRIGLTGTAMQNDLRELYTLTKLVRPNWIGDQSVFRSHFEKPIHDGLNPRFKDNLEVQEKAKRRAKALRKVLRKVILRRDKELVKDELPSKTDSVVFPKMTALQEKAYKAILALPESEALRTRDHPCDCGMPNALKGKCCYRTIPDGMLWRYYHFDSPDGCPRCPTCLQLPLMTLLSKVANHPKLLIDFGRTKSSRAVPENQEENVNNYEQDEQSEENEKIEDSWFRDQDEDEEYFSDVPIVEDNTERAKKAHWGELIEHILGENEFKDIRKQNMNDLTDEKYSGKLVLLGRLLNGWKNNPGSKVLIFSQYTRMLSLLEDFLQRQAVTFTRYDGSLTATKRREAIEAFCSDSTITVLLISTRAGGVGLNLTVANRVAILDPMWNVALDSQAQDRAFRLGQRQDVEVVRFFSRFSMEELVFHRQNLKQQLSRAVETNEKRRPTTKTMKASTDLSHEEMFGLTNILTWKGDEEANSSQRTSTKKKNFEELLTGSSQSSVKAVLPTSIPHVSSSAQPPVNRHEKKKDTESLEVERSGNVVLSLESINNATESQEASQYSYELETDDIKTNTEKSFEKFMSSMKTQQSKKSDKTVSVALQPNFERRYKRKRRFQVETVEDSP